jgi:hypothetical protein
MQFVNPLELLKIREVSGLEINSTLVKKQKRLLIADIELADNNSFNYHNIQLTKSDCEKAIDELEDHEKIEFYLHLLTNKELNVFLINGDFNSLKNLRIESIYNLEKFVDFVSPFYAEKLNKLLAELFLNNNLTDLQIVLRAPFLVSKTDTIKAYRDLTQEIESRISFIDVLTEEIKEERSRYSDDNIEEILQLINEKFPQECLNSLPIYFQSSINKIAKSLNFLQLNIWNEFNTTLVPKLILEHLLELNIESVSKPTFEKNYDIVRKKHEERIEQEKNTPLLKDWARVLISIQEKVVEVENETLKAVDALGYVKSVFNLQTLNNLPPFANEIRTQIGYSIRSMSIASWNQQSDIKSSLELIEYALQINVNSNAKEKFTIDRTELLEIQKKYSDVLICHFCGTSPPDKGCEIQTTIYKETSRSWFPRRSVQFSYSEIAIPRCSNCQEVHSKGKNIYNIIFFGLLILGVIVGTSTDGEHFIIGGIIGAGLGWLIGATIEKNQINEAAVKDYSNSSLASHPLLIDRIKNGWTFSKPTA